MIKDKISPLRVASNFWHSPFDKNTIIFAPSNEKAVIDFVNYCFIKSKPYRFIDDIWSDGICLNCILLKRDDTGKWHLWLGLHADPCIEIPSESDIKIQKLIAAFLMECWDSYFEGEKFPF